jgi:hypothetical protein
VLADAGAGTVAGAAITGAEALAAGLEAGAVADCCWLPARARVVKATQRIMDTFIVGAAVIVFRDARV